ncbi:MAG: HD domain-containing protein [Bacteroidota bacterium]|nr:HD domain-containing protein [Bacteroidota bacterium]
MTNIELSEKYIIWFDEYVNSFIKSHPDLKENLMLKLVHSKNVREEIIGIAKDIHLDKENLFLAEILGLFHDIGRFEQYAKYKTFSDSDSQNHAELGVKVLKEEDVLKHLTAENRELIYKAILNHSKAEIPANETERAIFFSKLIRDADKLDIWRLITEYYMVKEEKTNRSLELGLPDNPDISEHVVQSIIKKEIVKKEDMKTLNDFKLLQIAWVFDLNFNFSRIRLKQKGFLKKIFDALPDNDKVKQIKNIVDKELSVMETKEK